MSRFKIAAAVAAVVLIGTAAYFFVLRDDAGAEFVDIERGTIDVSIDTVGTIQQRNPQPVRTNVAGTVEALGARVGDDVQAGDILVLLDQSELRTLVDNAESALETAEFRLQFAEQVLEEDEDSLEAQLAVVQALAGVNEARESLIDGQQAVRDGAITAPRAGTVLETYVVPGDPVMETQPIALLYAPEDLILVADIDELDLPNVDPGAPAQFRLDSYPATRVEGMVASTSPQAVQRGGATLFPADVLFDVPPDVDIRPGMNAEVTILTELREDVLLVPERALKTVGQRAFVLVERDGELEEVEVVLGYRSGGMAEIVEGLQEEDRIQLR